MSVEPKETAMGMSETHTKPSSHHMDPLPSVLRVLPTDLSGAMNSTRMHFHTGDTIMTKMRTLTTTNQAARDILTLSTAINNLEHTTELIHSVI